MKVERLPSLFKLLASSRILRNGFFNSHSMIDKCYSPQNNISFSSRTSPKINRDQFGLYSDL